MWKLTFGMLGTYVTLWARAACNTYYISIPTCMERRETREVLPNEEEGTEQERRLEQLRVLVERTTRWHSDARLELMRLGSPLADSPKFWKESLELTDAWRELALRLLQVTDRRYIEHVERQSR